MRQNKLAIKIIVLLLIGLGSAYVRVNNNKLALPPISQNNPAGLTDLAVIKNAYDNQHSNLQVKQTGRVVKLLRDDNYGARHQKFVVQLASGQKLLIAHNLDLAPKVDNLKEGDTIGFFGEFEWNNKGGVVHWTHHDPKGRHQAGWLLHNERTYQ